MQVIALQNMIHKGRRYKAGEAIEMDAEHADALQLAGLVYIGSAPAEMVVKTAIDAPESGETEQPQGEAQPKQENASKRGKKASK